MNITTARWRKATDVDRDHALFELVSDGAVLLDVGFSNEGVFEIAFHNGIMNVIVPLDEFERIIENGKSLAKADM